MTEATASNYWISSTALSITLNAMGDADYIQANAASGAMIMCYMRDIDGLGYDNGHNYLRWPLVANPTYFNSTSKKYVYAAIPRKDNADNATAFIVYPSERVDVYGKSSSGIQLGSVDYYYIFLGGIISASVVDGVIQQRTWSQRVDSGKLASDEAIANGGDNTWWLYNAVDNTVSFLKTITKAVFEHIEVKYALIKSLSLGGVSLTGVAGRETLLDSTSDIVTPNYLSHIADSSFLRKDKEDAARELITFLKGIILGKDYSITAQGKAVLSSIFGKLFQQGINGRDFGFWTDEEGRGHAEVDFLSVRIKQFIQSLELRELNYVGGNFTFSAAGSRLHRVVPVDSGGKKVSSPEVPFAYRCYMVADDGSTRTMNHWRVGDQAKCQTFDLSQNAVEDDVSYLQNTFLTAGGGFIPANGKSFSFAKKMHHKVSTYKNVDNKYYWRMVVGTGQETLEDGRLYSYIDLANKLSVSVEYEGKTYACIGYDGSTVPSIPAENDKIVQQGSQTDRRRQGVIEVCTEGDGSPYINFYAGVNDYNLSTHLVISLSPYKYLVSSQVFELRNYTGVSVPMTTVRGEWLAGVSYGHYDVVAHKGSLWLCKVAKGSITYAEPSEESPDWEKYVSRGEKGDKGVDSVSVKVVADGGNLKNGVGVRTLTATVYRGAEDITSEVTEFSWERLSGSVDAEWNAAHVNAGRTITVNAADINGSAQFTCLCPVEI